MATWIKAGFWEKLCKPCKGYKGWLNLDELIASIAGKAEYKIYRAILFQDGTASAPTAYVLENTLGTTPVWTYFDVGSYITDLGFGNLDVQKVHGLISLHTSANPYLSYIGVYNIYTPNTEKIITNFYNYDSTFVELGGYCSIEIKVYP